jgi:hypothetical protein
MASIEQFKTDKYGVLYAPRSFVEFSYLLEMLGPSDGSGAWRGQSNIRWKIQSAAARRIELALSSPYAYDLLRDPKLCLEERICKYEQRLFDEARKRGLDFRNGRHLSELEILACMQHYGAATRLLDFSKNVFVALWFACAFDINEFNNYGLLIGIEDPLAIEPISHTETAQRPLNQILEVPQDLFVWEPPHLFDRMRVQQSVFLFGKSQDGPWGSLSCEPFYSENAPPDIPPLHNFVAFAIHPALKEDMKGKWRSLFGYDVSTLFPDIEGFGKYHSARELFEWDYFLG